MTSPIGRPVPDGAVPGRTPEWRVLQMGERAVLVEGADPDVVAALARALSEYPAPGQRELVPGARSVLILSDTEIDIDPVTAHLGGLTVTTGMRSGVETVTVDVVYDGPDLAEVAELTGLGVDGVIAAHTGRHWRVAFTGFAPGFGYLTGGDPRLRMPRRDTPRPAVPAGSVGLAGEYSGVYPRESPGGWQLIGRTDAPLWDPDRDPPALLRPGAVVIFRAVAELPPPSRVVYSTTGHRPSWSTRLGGGRTLTVARSGISCLVQDLGRIGLAAEGVGRSGAADRGAAQRANRIVGNRVGAAVLELIPGRVEVRAGGALLVAVTGAVAEVAVDGGRRPRDAPIALDDGQTLTISTPSAGLRCYLAVRGGIAVDPVLHSRSTDLLTGIGPPPVHARDVLPIGDDHWGTPHVVPPPPRPGIVDAVAHGAVEVGVLPGPQSDWFAGGVGALTGTSWRVLPTSNRVGIRLDGPSLRRTIGGEVATQGLVPGAIQVPPDGHPVVMLADHPVTGGYPVIGVVAAADLDVLAQLRPGAALRCGSAGLRAR